MSAEEWSGVRAADAISVYCLPFNPNAFGISELQKMNTNMLAESAYRDEGEPHDITLNHRYQLLPDDFSSLYCQQYQKYHNIDVKIAP